MIAVLGQKSAWEEGWPGASVCPGAVEVCIGDDKDSKNSADKTQRARTEEYEGPLTGRGQLEVDRVKEGRENEFTDVLRALGISKHNKGWMEHLLDPEASAGCAGLWKVRKWSGLRSEESGPQDTHLV